MLLPKKGVSIFLLALFFILSFSPFALAAPELVISQGYLKVWPEYTQPYVVVNFACTYLNPSQEDFSGQLSFSLPKDATVYMVSETKNGIISVPFEVAEEGKYQVVKWEPSQPLKAGEEYSVMLEYSYSPLTKAGARDIKVPFVAPAEIRNLTVEIQEPLRAEGFQLDPPAEQTSQDLEGFTVHTLNYQNLAAGKELNFSLRYSKGDNEPSIQIPAETKTKEKSNNLLIVFFTLFVVLLGIILIISINKDEGFKGKKQRPQAHNGKALSRGDKNKRRKELRKMLVEGKITVEKYETLMKKLDGQGR